MAVKKIVNVFVQRVDKTPLESIIITIEREVIIMRDLIKVVIWFFVINFSICNHIWTKPVSYWWVIEIVVLIISILMVDKSAEK